MYTYMARLKNILNPRVLGLSGPILALVTLSCVGIAAIGLWLDAKDFFVGLLVSVVSLVVAGLAATFVFDRLTERQSERRRSAKWLGVRTGTLTAIWEQTRRMMEPIRELSPEHDSFSIDYEGSMRLMDDVHGWVCAQAKPLDKSLADGRDRYEKFKSEMMALHDSVFKEFVYVRDVLMARVLELANDPGLTELLIALDATERQWSGCVSIAGPGETELSWANFPITVWNAVAAFYLAAINVVKYISDELPEPRPLRLVLVEVGDRTVARAWTMYE